MLFSICVIKRKIFMLISFKYPKRGSNLTANLKPQFFSILRGCISMYENLLNKIVIASSKNAF